MKVVPHRFFPEIVTAVPEILRRVQELYDSWEQDEDGVDEMYGVGGICHDIADILVSEVSQTGLEILSVSSTHEVHVYTVFRVKTGPMAGVYELDIPYNTYETGAGYTWEKVPDVTFTSEDLVIVQLDRDPNSFSEYVEDFDEDLDLVNEERKSSPTRLKIILHPR